MDVKREENNGIESEEDEGVNEDGLAVCLHATELKLFVGAGEGKEQTRLKQDEEDDADHHRSPVRH
ncbi:hypothetical protein QN277_013643 [Acacia crassicarpa]|uniref:Uncharacterized protein n=1 Tax=Acacia crassicarpa TaxID=499986 RepID=A0AAE1TEK7_9FABA|nr:hypothetical protein QN277_013643 [Acacia crassicarpa]